MTSIPVTGTLNAYRLAHSLIAAVRGLYKQVSFVDQVTRRVGGVRLVTLLLRGKQIVSEFTAGKGIEKFLRIVKPYAEFADHLIGILRDIWILHLDQASRGVHHGLISELPRSLRLTIFQSYLGLEDLSFGPPEIEIGRGHHSPPPLPTPSISPPS